MCLNNQLLTRYMYFDIFYDLSLSNIQANFEVIFSRLLSNKRASLKNFQCLWKKKRVTDYQSLWLKISPIFICKDSARFDLWFYLLTHRKAVSDFFCLFFVCCNFSLLFFSLLSKEKERDHQFYLVFKEVSSKRLIRMHP